MTEAADRAARVARNMRALASDDGFHAILAIDHGRSALDLLDTRDGSDGELLATAKSAVIDALSHHCTSLLVDLPLAQGAGSRWRPPDGVPLIIGLDDYDYDDVTFPPPEVPEPRLIDDALAAGATAAKIVLYYDPSSADAPARCDAVAQIAGQCHAAGLPLLVEPLPIPTVGRGGDDPWPVAEVAAHAAATGSDILKLPLSLGPRIADESAGITEAARGVPWILLSSGVPFPEFLDTLRYAMRGGAVGFAAGRSIWRDLISNVTDPDVKREASQRLAEAADLTFTLGRSDRP